MPCDPIDLLCADLCLADYAYGPGTPATLAALGGLVMEEEILGLDGHAGMSVAVDPFNGLSYCVFHGTEDLWPDGILDVDFMPESCELAPGAIWTDGAARWFRSLTVRGQPLTSYLAGSPTSSMRFTGHSAGAWLALFAAMSNGAAGVTLLSPPNALNAAGVAAVKASLWFAASRAYAGQFDIVPDFPKLVWPLPEILQAIPLRLLSPNLLTPPLSRLALPQHRCANVRAMMAALP